MIDLWFWISLVVAGIAVVLNWVSRGRPTTGLFAYLYFFGPVAVLVLTGLLATIWLPDGASRQGYALSLTIASIALIVMWYVRMHAAQRPPQPRHRD